VFSNNSNVHVAKDRAWFTDYTPYESVVGDFYGMVKDGLRVEGIGTVELPTKRSPNRSGRDSHGTLRLTNVLHVPSALCNIIGGPILEDYNVTTGSVGKASRGSIKDQKGRSVAYFDSRRCLFQVKLRGHPVESNVLKDGQHYVINAMWPNSERQKWEAHQGRTTHHPRPGYTEKEKEWLKENYRSEFQFLRDFGLSIYKDEDREEGRTILRSLMQREEEEELEDEEEDKEEDEDKDEDEDEDEDSESSLEGHMADYHFTEAELEYIEKEYGNSMNFLYSYGLKFYDDNDCEEGRSILKGLMSS